MTTLLSTSSFCSSFISFLGLHRPPVFFRVQLFISGFEFDFQRQTSRVRFPILMNNTTFGFALALVSYPLVFKIQGQPCRSLSRLLMRQVMCYNKGYTLNMLYHRASSQQ